MPGTGWPGPRAATPHAPDAGADCSGGADAGGGGSSFDPPDGVVDRARTAEQSLDWPAEPPLGDGDGVGDDGFVAAAGDRSAGPVAGGRGWDHEADRWLVEQAVAGHGQAFEVLLRRHQNRIYGIALRMTGDPTAAEDVAQDVAIQLWRVLATFTGASMFTTWLYRIVVNRCLNHQRAARVTGRDTRPLLDTEHPPTIGPEQRIVDAAHLDAAATALAALPPDQRTAVVLCQIEGMSYREAAAITNVSEPALRSRLERGRKNLLAAMGEWT